MPEIEVVALWKTTTAACTVNQATIPAVSACLDSDHTISANGAGLSQRILYQPTPFVAGAMVHGTLLRRAMCTAARCVCMGP